VIMTSVEDRRASYLLRPEGQFLRDDRDRRNFDCQYASNPWDWCSN
jgi:hypothetical protein